MATKHTDLVRRRRPQPPSPSHPAPAGCDDDEVAPEFGDDFDSEETVPENRLPAALAVMVVIVLDVSGSLASFTDAIRNGLARLIESLRRDSTTSVSVDLLLLTFSDRVKAYGFATPHNFEMPSISCSGTTAMGAAVAEAKNRVEARLREYAVSGTQLNRCMVLVISDGHPSDEYEESFAALRAFEARMSKVEVFPVAAGNAAVAVLNRLSKVREAAPLDTLQFEKLFNWIFESTRMVSASQPGERVELPAPTGWLKTRK